MIETIASAAKERDTPQDERRARSPDDPGTPVIVECSEALSLRREMRFVLGRKLGIPRDRAAAGAASASRAKSAELLNRLRERVHALGDDEAPMALCLSGGGIRSATFGLGVLQGLARTDRLQRFDYLSTVSGGGYVGSWLIAWQARHAARSRRQRRDGVAAELKASAVGRLSGGTPPPQPGVAAPAPEPEQVRRLRAYSNYLSPALGLGGDLMSLVAIFGRNLFLHWSVLLPALLALLMVPRVYLALVHGMADLPADAGLPGWIALLALLALALGTLVFDPSGGWPALLSLGGAGMTLVAMLAHGTPGLLMAGAAIVGIAISVAYMAADLPAPVRASDLKNASVRPPLAAPNHFVRWSLLPLIGASFCLSLMLPWLAGHLATAEITGAGTLAQCVAYAALFGFVHVVAAVAGVLWREDRGLRPRDFARSELAVTFLIGALGGLLLLGAVHALAPLLDEPAAEQRLWWHALAGQREIYAIVAMPAMLAVFWLTVTSYAAVTRRHKSEEDREWWARAAGLWILSAMAWLALAFGVLVLPRWLLGLVDALGFDTAGSSSLTGGATLLGIAASAWGFWSRNSQKIIDQAHGLAARLGARLLEAASALFVVLLLAVFGLALSSPLEGVMAHVAVSTAGSAKAWRVDTLEKELAASDRQDRCTKAVAAASVVTVKNRGPATTSASVPVLTCARLPLSPTVQTAARFRGVLHATSAPVALGLFAGLALAALGMAHSVGTNTFSLHSMYGNRLIRAYLGASNPPDRRRPQPFTGFDPLDNIELVRLAGCRPFIVVNAALNIVQPSGDRLEWQQRKAASFTFTPLACGSAVLGYAPTLHYAKKPLETLGAASRATRAADREPGDWSLSVGRAMAISGAAAAPNMGYHSSTIVAFVMSFFNVRLGWWLPNPRVLPGRDALETWTRDEPPAAKTLLAETFARTRKDSDFVYLSDGGHFENLGLYEMVRRRCRRIVVADATRDADFLHEDLLSSLRKIRIDLGISIEFPLGLPTAESCRKHGKPWSVGRIHYAEADAKAPVGSIVYLKPALWDGLPPDVTSYAERSKKRGTPFPHQSTGDQFFDEAQFESYRMLGLLTVLKAFGNDPRRWPGDPGPDHRVVASAPTSEGALSAWVKRLAAARPRLRPARDER